jgi:predicted RNA-binding protein YlqC (UPF0109 family)
VNTNSCILACNVGLLPCIAKTLSTQHSDDHLQLEKWPGTCNVLRDIPEVYRVTESIAPLDNATVISEMQALISEIAKALVDDTAAVQVEVIDESDATVLRLHVAPGDIGKVIGKQGRTARSLRTILGAASMKLQRRFSLDIVEVGKSFS